MIDFHNHVIPNVDDGSKSIEMSINMLRKAYHDDIKCVVNTVHYDHPKMIDLNPNFDIISEKIKEIQKKLVKENISIEILSSAEVYFTRRIYHQEKKFI